MNGLDLLTDIAAFACIVPILTGLFRYKQLPKTTRIFFYFILYCGFSEWLAYYLAQTQHNNLPPLYLFTLVEFGIFCYVLIPQLTLINRWSKQILWGMIILMLCLLALDIVIHSIYRWNTISRTSECFLIVLMSLAYLLEHFQSDKNINLSREYIFWIATGAGMYFAVSFFYNLFAIRVTMHMRLNVILQTVHLLASTLSYLFFAFSFLICKPR